MPESDASATAPEAREAREDSEMFRLQQLRAMEQPSWSEGRLDDLNRKVDAGIGRLDDERKEFRGEMRAGFDRVDDEFKSVRSEMKEGFDKVNERFDRLQWNLLAGAIAIIAALIASPHL
jgi:hypothetical protein